MAEENTNPLDTVRAKGVSLANIERLATELPFEQVISCIREMFGALLSNDKPDWRARETGVKLWLSYVIGLPVQRQEIITHKVTSAPTTAQLLKNPATREALVRQIAGDPESRKALLDMLKDDGREDWGEGGALVPT